MSESSYAKMILHWAVTTFGPVALDPKERVRRLLEEAVEVAQAGDVSQEQAMAILQRTYSRPIGEINKEIGGLLVTIYAFCGLYGSDPRYLLEREVERVLAKDPEVWRKKHAEKVADGTAS